MPFRHPTQALALALTLAAPAALAAGPYTGSVTYLYNFTGGKDGGDPRGGIIPDSFGNLYGATSTGGANGGGTIFKLAANGEFTTLYQFQGTTGYVSNALTLHQGKLYGTAIGASSIRSTMIFSINPDGSCFTDLYDFTKGDGYYVHSPLVPVPGGGLAGVTFDGALGYGTVFLYLPNGKMLLLHRFTGAADDGGTPNALLADPQGNLFGTTATGGTGCNPRQTCGIVFEITHDAHQFQPLYAFTGPYGTNPILGSIDSNGVLYGVTQNPSATSQSVAFSLAPGAAGWQFTALSTLHTAVVGDSPTSGPVPGPAHSLVGFDGSSIYQILNGLFYHGEIGGYYGYGPTLVGAHGNVYGTCYENGCGSGAIFRYTVTKTAN